MLNLEKTSLYRPEVFTRDDLQAYTDALKDLDAARASDSDAQTSATQLADVIKKLQAQLKQHPHLNTPIFTYSGPEYPLQKLIKELDNPTVLNAAGLDKRIEWLISQYELNELPHDIDVMEQEQFRPMVNKANRTGHELRQAFTSIMSDLATIKKRDHSVDIKLQAIKVKCERAKPHVKVINNLESARTHALRSLQDEARKKNVLGVATLCDGILAGQGLNWGRNSPDEQIKQLMSDISTLREPNPTQRQYITHITDILQAHKKNIDQVNRVLTEGHDRFNEKTLSGAKVAAGATAAGAVDDPATRLKQLLTQYIDKRAQVLGRDQQTKQYYSPIGTFFQNSFDQEKGAVNALIKRLDGENIDLMPHLSVLRAGDLGSALRGFIKAGAGDVIVGQSVKTISDFVKVLQHPAAPAP